MKCFVDCIPCFFRQALEAAKIAGATEVQQKDILYEFANYLPQVSMDIPPPQSSRIFYNLVKEITQNSDPYLEQKKKSIELALAAYPQLKKRLVSAQDKLKLAVELAIAGNIIDYGVKNNFDVDQELEKILAEEKQAIEHEDLRFFDYKAFQEVLKVAKSILYLGDNAGETVFDRILIEQILEDYPNKQITYVVKEQPIINDALKQDAIDSGLDKSCAIISSGSDAPGTPLSLCSANFVERFQQADLVISKGQGNFETLSQESRPIFFLFKAKCPVVAKHMNCGLGDIILYYSKDLTI